jgi:hypothetical protein
MASQWAHCPCAACSRQGAPELRDRRYRERHRAAEAREAARCADRANRKRGYAYQQEHDNLRQKRPREDKKDLNHDQIEVGVDAEVGPSRSRSASDGDLASGGSMSSDTSSTCSSSETTSHTDTSSSDDGDSDGWWKPDTTCGDADMKWVQTLSREVVALSVKLGFKVAQGMVDFLARYAGDTLTPRRRRLLPKTFRQTLKRYGLRL